jgi:hypothetical protein
MYLNWHVRAIISQQIAGNARGVISDFGTITGDFRSSPNNIDLPMAREGFCVKH